MKNISNYNDFLINNLFEKLNLKIKKLELVLSPSLIKILKEMNHEIADELLAAHMSDEQNYKQTFIDLSKDFTKPEEITFIQSNKVADLVEPDVVHGDYHHEEDEDGNFIGGYFDIVPMSKNDNISDVAHLPDLHDDRFKDMKHDVWNKNRVPMKIGRFIKGIFKNKFPDNKTRKELSNGSKPNDIESFVNMYVATITKHSKQFAVVSGDDIRHYYDRDNYFKTTGTLGGSCMSHGCDSNFLSIYTENPEKVSMLILYPEDVDDEIIGRAILWKLDEPDGRIYMERIYTADDTDEYMFINYAKEKGYLYKSSQKYGYGYDIVDPKTKETKQIKLVVKLKPLDYDEYPYADTLQLYDSETGVITNNAEFARESENEIKLLTSTTGIPDTFR